MNILSIHMNCVINGGAEVVCLEGNRLLAQKGHAIAWLSIGVPQAAVQRGEPVFPVPELSSALKILTRHFYNGESARLAERAIRDFRPDVVHVHTVYGYRHLSPSVLLPFKRHNIPIIQTLHDFGLLCPASFFLSKGEVCEDCRGGKYFSCTKKRCIKDSLPRSAIASLNAYLKDYYYHYQDLITAFISPSHFLRQKYIQFGFPAEKIKVVPNAYFQNIEFAQNQRAKRRDYILFVGRLSQEKGVDVLLKASPGLDVPVKIVGEGEQFPYLQGLKNELGASQVEFLGKQPHEAMSALFRDAALTVFPSRWYENGPLVLLESFAQATPVVASRIGAIPEFVKDGETGYLFDVNDASELHQIIRRALARGNPETMEANALDAVRVDHAPELYAARLEAILAQAISRLN